MTASDTGQATKQISAKINFMQMGRSWVWKIISDWLHVSILGLLDVPIYQKKKQKKNHTD